MLLSFRFIVSSFTCLRCNWSTFRCQTSQVIFTIESHWRLFRHWYHVKCSDIICLRFSTCHCVYEALLFFFISFIHVCQTVIDRLINRGIYWLAFEICSYMKLHDTDATKRVLVHWASSLVSIVCILFAVKSASRDVVSLDERRNSVMFHFLSSISNLMRCLFTRWSMLLLLPWCVDVCSHVCVCLHQVSRDGDDDDRVADVIIRKIGHTQGTLHIPAITLAT